jgi:hypothetical protein
MFWGITGGLTGIGARRPTAVRRETVADKSAATARELIDALGTFGGPAPARVLLRVPDSNVNREVTRVSAYQLTEGPEPSRNLP